MSMTSSEKNQLLKEIAYLSSLIDTHKKQTGVQLPPAKSDGFLPTFQKFTKWSTDASSKPSVLTNRSTSKLTSGITPSTNLPHLQSALVDARKQLFTKQFITLKQKLNLWENTLESGSVSGTLLPPSFPTNHLLTVTTNENWKRTVVKVPNGGNRSVKTVNKAICSVADAVPRIQVTVTDNARSRIVASPIMTSVKRVVHLTQKDKPVQSDDVQFNSKRIVCSPTSSATARIVLKPSKYIWNSKIKPVPAKTSPPSTSMKPVLPANFKWKMPSTTIKQLPKMPARNATPASSLSKDKGKKTVKSKYKLIRKRTLSNESVKSVNVKFPRTSTPCVRKVGKYSIKYVKANKGARKMSFSLSPYHYNVGQKTSRSMKRYKGRTRSRTLSRSRTIFISPFHSKLSRRYSLTNKAVRPKSFQSPVSKNGPSRKLVMIGGILYNSSRTALSRTNKKTPVVKVARLDPKKTKIISVRGVKFRMDPTGKTLERIDTTGSFRSTSDSSSITTNSSFRNISLSRVDLGGRTFVQTEPGVLVQSQATQKRTLASRAVNRSIHRLTLASKKSSQYCMFFNRFGKCHKQVSGKCPYKHDPEKVAVCTRFLRGTCTVENCPFSHKVCRSKMPACSFFLQGRCSNDDCPYLHVNVSSDAELCGDFLKGYCSLGEKCKKRHTFTCPEFQLTGQCKDGDKCRLQHTVHKRRKRPLSETKTTVVEKTKPDKISCLEEEKVDNSTSESDTDDDECRPRKHRRLPSFIKLEDDSIEETQAVAKTQTNPESNVPLRIKPKFLS